MKFQSTLPARGSDRQAFVCSLLQPYFNPRSPRGGATSICPQECTPTADFNPRSPRGGATFMPATSAEPTSKFQSTLPARGSDGDWITLELPQGISIHAPREGSDGAPEENYHATTKISIHAPREGERPRYAVGKSGGEDFNPRSPRGGATAIIISICCYKTKYFNPRSPRGGATVRGARP